MHDKGQGEHEWVPLQNPGQGSPALIPGRRMLWVRAGMMRARGVLAQRISSYIEVLMFF